MITLFCPSKLLKNATWSLQIFAYGPLFILYLFDVKSGFVEKNWSLEICRNLRSNVWKLIFFCRRSSINSNSWILLIFFFIYKKICSLREYKSFSIFCAFIFDEIYLEYTVIIIQFISTKYIKKIVSYLYYKILLYLYYKITS